ncbi:MAG: hypothetical protein WC462_04975 [archaeon]
MSSKLLTLVIIFFSVILLSLFGCTDDKTSGDFNLPNNLGDVNNQSFPDTNGGQKLSAKLYAQKYEFFEFKDPNESAFTINIPKNWVVSTDSGLVRPYIDAGVLLQVTSPQNQGFFYVSPYYLYTTPNDLLNYAGFTEGKYYDPSGGIAKPMMVKKYTQAKVYLNEYLQQFNVETELIEIIDRNNLIKSDPGPLITAQSAAEMTFISNPGPNQTKNKVIAFIYLVQTGSTGIWAVSLFGYSSPENLFNETEYLVLKSEESFKVDSAWAAREAQEINKRAGIISSTQESISESISSTFEYRSQSMDKINNEWSKTILGIEEVYNPATDDTYTVNSGSNYYWIDNKNNIYGTETEENPFPNEDVKLLEIKK